MFAAHNNLKINSPAGEESHVPKLTVETIDNHIYFYADVDSDRCLALIRTIRELDGRLRNESISRMLTGESVEIPIWLHIESPGGGLFSAFAVADQIKGIKSPIYSVVEGYAASAATVISCSCRRRYILPSAFMLIHELSSFYWGKYDEFKDQMKMLDMAMERLSLFYAESTHMDLQKIKELLSHDSWFSAAQALEIGLVDSILG